MAEEKKHDKPVQQTETHKPVRQPARDSAEKISKVQESEGTRILLKVERPEAWPAPPPKKKD